MRISKDPAERRNEILDVAQQLFSAKGFDGTSTGDILEMAGIARGTLYYHFKSKEDVMDALIERCSAQLLDAAQKIAADKSLPVPERMARAVMALNIGNDGGEVVRHIHQPQNALMHQKLHQIVIRSVTPILAGIVREGVEQGVFHTPFPYESMEMAVTYANTVFDDADILCMTGEERMSRVRAFIFNMERLFGAEPGTLAGMMRPSGGNEGHHA